MSAPRALREQVLARRARETGPPLPRGRDRVVMAYPSPYRVGMSSLGYQWICSVLAEAGLGVERCFLPDEPGQVPLTMESLSPLRDFPVIAVSLAYELELAGLVDLLARAGIPPLRRDRDPRHPRVLIGGPLTFSNPVPAMPYADAMILGEADDVVVPAVAGFFDTGDFEHVASLDGGWVPSLGDVRVPVAKADDRLLPARSRLLTPDTELADMFLLEGERGCHRACTFCVMRRSTNGGMRLVEPERLSALIPEAARRVGLVGAAISDHPRLVDLLGTIVDSGRGVGVSSLRADRVALKPDIPRLLRKGGYATLTVASDAPSQRLRREIQKGTTEAHLVACAEAAREHEYRVLKVYMMVGVPGETDEDIEELVNFTRKLAAIHPVALGVAPFVPKVHTPLDGAPFAGIKTVEKRLERIRSGLRGHRAELRPTSARWAWVEYRLAQGGVAEGEAVVRAVEGGGSFAAWKAALG
ncbi:MAG: radical SAM protein [Deltaproteobacteria bacterium]|nr:radical SAM protein [Deltaproteobacteria bacterium]